ncbi:Fic family protein [Candidatus Cetobacterium colombiensis]|jgi:fido (protein-threonine AMPylation protein)|uniref:protein adenylyltransferase n=1 Tax=Candidatus Cetobacterium colombiensis TaxID=3073100 RepID=A0ABU4W5Y5_9FUSO|nr:Fic family protein [Candidatus Cetobacterium colombiensis]MDX8334931.1 Fic family protein [Candidatus Cetobacterium colombiensis]
MTLKNIPYEILKEYSIPVEKRIENWEVGIGLNEVDGLKPSKYLIQLTKDSIEGRKNFDEIEKELKTYYEKQDKETINYSEMECDLVSTRIAKLLEERSFVFSPIQLKSIHRNLFSGLLLDERDNKIGEYRKYNISKKEPILNGESVIYGEYTTIEEFLKYDFENENGKNYSEMDIEKQIKNLVKFTSAIWQIHPFIEGNTRTVAVFIQKYLLSMGYDVNNDLFKDNSIYFRNALVASNYSNIPKRVSPNFFYLEQFFLKLLYEKNINLKEIIIFKI